MKWRHDDVKYFANEQGIDIDVSDGEMVENFIKDEQHELLGYDNGIFYLVW